MAHFNPVEEDFELVLGTSGYLFTAGGIITGCTWHGTYIHWLQYISRAGLEELRGTFFGCSMIFNFSTIPLILKH